MKKMLFIAAIACLAISCNKAAQTEEAAVEEEVAVEAVEEAPACCEQHACCEAEAVEAEAEKSKIEVAIEKGTEAVAAGADAVEELKGLKK